MTETPDGVISSAIWELLGSPQNFRPTRLGETIEDSSLLQPVKQKLHNYGFNHIRDAIELSADQLLLRVSGFTKDDVIYLQLFLLHSGLSLAPLSEITDLFYRPFNITDEKVRYNTVPYGDEIAPGSDRGLFGDRLPGPTGWRSTFGQDPDGQ